jgi:hypothetical protein
LSTQVRFDFMTSLLTFMLKDRLSCLVTTYVRKRGADPVVHTPGATIHFMRAG